MNIYVGNLPYSTTDEDLRDLFETHGEVTSAKVIFDRESGRSKGFGFVEMSDDQDANSALSALDGNDYGGRPLKVNEARPKEDRPQRGPANKGSQGGGRSDGKFRR